MKRLLIFAVVLVLVQLGCNGNGTKRNVGGNGAAGDPLYVSPPPPAPTPK